jgi:hypothetical protein
LVIAIIHAHIAAAKHEKRSRHFGCGTIIRLLQLVLSSKTA